jgi:hypothetical protein
MRSIDALAPRRTLVWIVIIALGGLVVRIAAGGGALWLDEAWSAVLADQVRTPLGVFVQINHDNNHHLNSMWLQLVGIGAPPLLARALSIAAGTLGIVVAGLIGGRQGALAGIITALLFSLSPLLVSLGSEARGYAPMMLMVLVSVSYIDRHLDGDGRANRPVTLAICFFVGALFHLTMIFAACALVGWPLLVLGRRKGLSAGAKETALLLGPAVAALGLAIAIVFAPVLIGGAQFRFGSRQPFAMQQFLGGFCDLLGYSVGAPGLSFWLLAAAALLVILARSLGTKRLAFYWLAVFIFPLTVVALQMMNVGHARYYLVAALGLLLLLGEAIAALIRAGGWKAAAGAGVLLLFSGASMAANLELVRNKRADPGAAIRALADRTPVGARVMIEREADFAPLRVAAAEVGYPLAIVSGCQTAPFIFEGQFGMEGQSEANIVRCSASYRRIAHASFRGLVGQNWTLYERVD